MMITVKEMVIRTTPPRLAAAPIRAYLPGYDIHEHEHCASTQTHRDTHQRNALDTTTMPSH
eukprot:m.141360 g.141360  ORF g.141360 m.141360 type:complete len:61 (-) comp16125_c0_seq23:1624-1806(-)